MSQPYDAVLLVSFGGPEKPDDVLPFLENVLRGKNVPHERMLEVAEHYYLFGGESPLTPQNRALLVALVQELNTHGPQLPVYWGNRNWHPLLPEAIQQMADDGIQHALAFVTSAFGSYSGCRQYQEDLQRACQEVGPEAPQIDKLRLFYNHPGFIEPMADHLAAALEQVPAERRDAVPLLFTAHSIPRSMADVSPYEEQLHEACRLVAQRAGRGQWQLVYQSRSGPPSQPWLEPDLKDRIAQLHQAEAIQDVVVVPIGYLSEHMEVLYDLDLEAGSLCDELGINMVRARVVGNHPRFVQMIRELILERIDSQAPRLSLGPHGPSPDACPSGCCIRQ
ncbi:MAG: ferrochelatase [Thermoguttaceae bacterium]